jgi:hypothetical protein
MFVAGLLIGLGVVSDLTLTHEDYQSGSQAK